MHIAYAGQDIGVRIIFAGCAKLYVHFLFAQPACKKYGSIDAALVVLVHTNCCTPRPCLITLGAPASRHTWFNYDIRA